MYTAIIILTKDRIIDQQVVLTTIVGRCRVVETPFNNVVVIKGKLNEDERFHINEEIAKSFKDSSIMYISNLNTQYLENKVCY